jgi:hypothetical protein
VTSALIVPNLLRHSSQDFGRCVHALNYGLRFSAPLDQEDESVRPPVRRLIVCRAVNTPSRSSERRHARQTNARTVLQSERLAKPDIPRRMQRIAGLFDSQLLERSLCRSDAAAASPRLHYRIKYISATPVRYETARLAYVSLDMHLPATRANEEFNLHSIRPNVVEIDVLLPIDREVAVDALSIQ